MDKLKPCPFCGGEATLEDTSTGFGVICWNCQISTTMDWKSDKAIAIWNNRKNNEKSKDGQ